MASSVVRMDQVGKRYALGRYALRDISFELQKGEFTFITGVSGAGKSTLLKLLFMLERPSEGNIKVLEQDVGGLKKRHAPKYRRQIGFIFQDFKLLPDLTVFQNVALPLSIIKQSKDELIHRVQGVLSLVGLSGREGDYPAGLSGGEQQRVAIARSIVTRPAILLADEPTGNLDSRNARDVMSLFQEIQEMGTTVVIATHDESLMEEFPARVIELKGGHLISDTHTSLDL